MVEIHEPVRMLFVVETTPERLMQVIDASASLKQLVENRWIRIATIDPDSGRVHVRRDGGFEEFDESVERLPVALSSAEWYAGKIAASPDGLDSGWAGGAGTSELSPEPCWCLWCWRRAWSSRVLALLWLLGWVPPRTRCLAGSRASTFSACVLGAGCDPAGIWLRRALRP